MITFANGKSYEQISVLGGVQSFQGQLRNTLAIKFLASTITLAEATEIYKDSEALKEISISETYIENEVECTRGSIKLNYTLPVDLTLSTEKIAPNEIAEIVTIKVAQKSSLEITQEQMSNDINDTQMAIIELADIIAGGNE